MDKLQIITSICAFALGIVIKTILDFNLAIISVKYLSRIPSGWLFRNNPKQLAGTWQHLWEDGGSVEFSNAADRHSHPKLQQFGNYIYAESYSKKRLYYFFGKITGEHIIGTWGDCNDPSGYFGTFQLRIKDANHLTGIWIGHSKSVMEIRSDKSTWERIGVES